MTPNPIPITMNQRLVFVADIQRAVECHYGLPAGTLRQRDAIGTRERDKAHPRQMAMLVARRMTRKQYTVLGRSFRRDHSTIISGIRAARRRCLADREHIRALCEIRARVLETAAIFPVDDPHVPQAADNRDSEEDCPQPIHSCAPYVPLDALVGSGA